MNTNDAKFNNGMRISELIAYLQNIIVEHGDNRIYLSVRDTNNNRADISVINPSSHDGMTELHFRLEDNVYTNKRPQISFHKKSH
jgi:hypothetical protein